MVFLMTEQESGPRKEGFITIKDTYEVIQIATQKVLCRRNLRYYQYT